mmetsp:Transcript_146310/g.469348  ORF Transcript_146310/g.469348 Transcript_146310/m.469348 type:complete len:82 (+) Transcript_146310:251-496(+)
MEPLAFRTGVWLWRKWFICVRLLAAVVNLQSLWVSCANEKDAVSPGILALDMGIVATFARHAAANMDPLARHANMAAVPTG